MMLDDLDKLSFLQMKHNLDQQWLLEIARELDTISPHLQLVLGLQPNSAPSK